jgi:hypothetical protein
MEHLYLASLSLAVGAICTWACVIEFARYSNVSALFADIRVYLGLLGHHHQAIRTEDGGDSHCS